MVEEADEIEEVQEIPTLRSTRKVVEEEEPEPQRYKVREYQADGGFTMLGIVLIFSIEIVAGLFLGFVTSFISQFFYLIILFPIGIGFLLGVAGIPGIRLGKVRNPWLGGLAGLVGGCVAMIGVQFFDYLGFLSEAEEIRAELQKPPEPPKPFHMGEHPRPFVPGINVQAAKEILEVQSFPGYIDYAARQGVSIGRARDRGKGWNLGHVGTYIYWLIELGIVAFIALALMLAKASEPYCRGCDSWKKERPLITLEGMEEDVLKAVRRGDVEDLAQFDESEDEVGLKILVASCPNCQEAEPIAVKLVRVVKDNKKEQKTTDLAHVSYPGEALLDLEKAFPARQRRRRSLGNGGDNALPVLWSRRGHLLAVH